jgi:hypothetical protein
LRGVHTLPEKAPESADGFPLRWFLRESRNIKDLLHRTLPNLMAEVDLMEEALHALQPKRLWVGNQWGSEGAMIQVAQLHGVQVTQVQHGTLEQYFALSPTYTDEFKVWGPFWRDLLLQGSQVRVEAADTSPVVAAHPTSKSRTRRVTLFTAPVGMLPLWNPYSASHEAIDLVNSLAEEGYSVNVRIHPSERLASWQSHWRRAGADPSVVVFDKGSPIDRVIAETDVAIVYFSTVFLQCIRQGVPVVSLGWFPLMWRKQLEKRSAVFFADSIASARDYVLKGDYTSPDAAGLLPPD